MNAIGPVAAVDDRAARCLIAHGLAARPGEFIRVDVPAPTGLDARPRDPDRAPIQPERGERENTASKRVSAPGAERPYQNLPARRRDRRGAPNAHPA